MRVTVQLLRHKPGRPKCRKEAGRGPWRVQVRCGAAAWGRYALVGGRVVGPTSNCKEMQIKVRRDIFTATFRISKDLKKG